MSREKIAVATGRFREMMEVHLVNDGPVTLLLDKDRLDQLRGNPNPFQPRYS